MHTKLFRHDTRRLCKEIIANKALNTSPTVTQPRSPFAQYVNFARMVLQQFLKYAKDSPQWLQGKFTVSARSHL